MDPGTRPALCDDAPVSLGALICRLIGILAMAVGGWLLFQGSVTPLTGVIIIGCGVVFFMGARLSR
jgi:hypothetical protein